MQLIDTHSHLYAEEFDADRNEALSRAREAGVERLLLPASTLRVTSDCLRWLLKHLICVV